MHVGPHGARPVQGDERGDVLEAVRGNRPNQRPHRRRLQLEDPDGLALGQHGERGGVVERDVVDVDVHATMLADQLERVRDHVKVAQAEEVHLQQAEVFAGTPLELGHHRGILGVAAGFRLPLNRQVVGERTLGNHHRGGVDAVLAPQPLDALGDVHDLFCVGIGGVHVPQLGGHLVAAKVLGVLLQAGVERRVTAHHQRRHGLGHLVAERVRVAEHPRRVAHRGTGLDRGERDDLGDVLAAVPLGRIADHLVPVTRVEVHVDIGHRHALRVEKPFEKQVVADRIQFGDAKAVGHRAAGRGAAARTHPDVQVTGVLDQVPGDDEVRRVAHLVDDVELVVDALACLGGERCAPTHVGALVGQRLQILGVGGVALGQRKLGQFRLGELDFEVAALGDPQGVVARHLHLAKQVSHFLGRLQVVVRTVKPEPLFVGDERPGLHAEQSVVGLGVLTRDVVAVVGGQQRRPQALGDLDQLRVGLVLFGDAVILDLDEQVVASKDVLQATGLLQRRVEALVHQRLQHMATQAAGGGDHALGVLRQQLPVEPWLVVVPLEERLGTQLDEVLVAGEVLGQQREVVVELPAALNLAAGVVHPTSP